MADLVVYGAPLSPFVRKAEVALTDIHWYTIPRQAILARIAAPQPGATRHD